MSRRVYNTKARARAALKAARVAGKLAAIYGCSNGTYVVHTVRTVSTPK